MVALLCVSAGEEMVAVLDRALAAVADQGANLADVALEAEAEVVDADLAAVIVGDVAVVALILESVLILAKDLVLVLAPHHVKDSENVLLLLVVLTV